MTKAERTERMRALSRLALGIARRCGEGGIVDRGSGRYRLSEVRHNEIRITLLRPIGNDSRTSSLHIRFNGKAVLRVEWLPEAVQRTSYRPGSWEAMLARYDRAPVFAGSERKVSA